MIQSYCKSGSDSENISGQDRVVVKLMRWVASSSQARYDICTDASGNVKHELGVSESIRGHADIPHGRCKIESISDRAMVR